MKLPIKKNLKCLLRHKWVERGTRMFKGKYKEKSGTVIGIRFYECARCLKRAHKYITAEELGKYNQYETPEEEQAEEVKKEEYDREDGLRNSPH